MRTRKPPLTGTTSPMPYHRRSPMSPLQSHFGQIDIYLFDQLLRGRIVPGMRIFDAGCGSGRNLAYLLREGYEVFGADPDPRAIAATRALSASLAPALPASNFHMEAIEDMSFAQLARGPPA